jgi:hypothetical protein
MSSQRLGRKPKPADDGDSSDDDDDEVKRRRERSPSSSPLPDVDGLRSRSPSSSPLPGDDFDSDASDDEGAAFAAAMRAELRGERPKEKKERDTKFAGKEGPKGKASARPFKERAFDRSERFERGGKPDLRKGSKARAERVQPQKPAPRALSPEKETPSAASTTSFRTFKKEAFGKHHHAGGKRGQPNMGARMDVLLQRIRSSK